MDVKTTITEDKERGLWRVEVFADGDCIMSRVASTANELKNLALDAIFCEHHAEQLHSELFPKEQPR